MTFVTHYNKFWTLLFLLYFKHAPMNHYRSCASEVIFTGLNKYTRLSTFQNRMDTILRTVRNTNLATKSHLSALQSTSADKYSGCKSNTLCPRGLSGTVESPLMNLIRGLLEQQASFFVTADKTSYCPPGLLLSALQRMASQLAFVLIMLEPSSHCAVGSIPMLN